LVTRLPSVILRGTDLATDRALAALMPTLFGPIYLWCRGMPLSLPSKRGGTQILRDLARLDGNQQKKLVRWLDDTDGRVHIVSTTSVPLYPLFERGVFLENLYDRLNVIQVDVETTNDPEQPTAWRKDPLPKLGIARRSPKTTDPFGQSLPGDLDILPPR
jgi:hypothetical protein